MMRWHDDDVDSVHVERIDSSGDQLLKNVILDHGNFLCLTTIYYNGKFVGLTMTNKFNIPLHKNDVLSDLLTWQVSNFSRAQTFFGETEFAM
jgi:hypothetical protein